MLHTGNLDRAPRRFVFTNFKDFCIKQVGLSLPIGRGKSGQQRAPCFLTGRTVFGRDRQCNRKQTVHHGWIRVKRWGKSPPLREKSTRHGKPHREQDRIGNLGTARSIAWRKPVWVPGKIAKINDPLHSPECRQNSAYSSSGTSPDFSQACLWPVNRRYRWISPERRLRVQF